MADINPTATMGRMLTGLTSKQIMALIVVIAGTIALAAGMWMWSKTPDYRVLYSNLSDRDGGAIIEALQQQNVPYKFSEGGGALLVPADKVHEVRLRLASQGLPKGGASGFELMENQKFGTSQFLEQVNYQRALEGELARSMQTLAAVQSARVHLAIPKPTIFVKEQQKPSASVVLTLHHGRMLDPGQINGIVHLVSSSIPNMSAGNVTVLDQSGTLLSPNKERQDGTMLDPTQIKYVRQIEQDFVKRIEAIVVPLIGPDNVHAQVTADIDFSQSEQTAESYKPNQPPNEAAVRSQQSQESVSNSPRQNGGVPGALSNQPPVPATAPIVNPASAIEASSAVAAVDTHKEVTTNYEVDRTIRYTKIPVGSIRRLSAAVVLNHRTITGKDGQTTTQPLSEEEKDQITMLVKEAIGFDANRGDSLSILNSAFNPPKEAEAEAEIPLWKQPETVDMVWTGLKYLIIAGIALYLLLGVIRPAVRNLTPPPPPPPAPHEEMAVIEREAVKSYESNLQSARQIAQNDPKIVASVVKEWVSKDE